ncbi:hypothetical protein [Desulfofustis glycolicus]|uniref:Curli production assembly/transport component CsgG n=1 Tax=Desulfofustis glycolicus DSM 9705 TaxID=1121409 RepID=A0A1M5SEK6_9BACT|nr:hypothetical protein [Desulfofustis glycolicus]MCB2216124.1 hypothetical protein [Desulfobulbaceae bacterium]SHH36956.1 hypothetical protein SAMN02745124_00310 [Desulfofustis glycolicus DSM 9705]
MNRLKYLMVGFLALLLAGCGQTVVETLNVPQGPGLNGLGQGKTAVILPFADYSFADNLASAHRRNLQISESLTDRLVANGFRLPIQEDVFRYMVDQSLINLVAYEESHSTSLNNELTGDWSSVMKEKIRGYILQQQVARDNKAVSAPGTHGLTTDNIRKIGRQFQADYIIRGRVLEFKTRQEATWEPWKKGVLPFVLGGTSRIAYGFAGSDQYDRWEQMTAGAGWGGLIGSEAEWPYDPDSGRTYFGASNSTTNSIFWAATGAVFGDQAFNSGRVDQAVVQMRIWVQEAATGNIVWTNRIRVQVSPESFFSDSQYDALFDSAIEKAVTSLVDDFVTYGL